MAPKRTPAKPTTGEDQVHDARIKRPKKKHSPVQRLENGLLNVNRTRGKNVPIINRNLQTPLLSLPAELGRMIWEYALGGHIFNVRRVKKRLIALFDLPKWQCLTIASLFFKHDDRSMLRPALCL
ncbi:hypothetical protein EK21DRAFT_112318 [Setomelanomma holmii]|uniref:Uncharacterized protein n=1 Tax=Setomelanomma holmii TaxID=210430 RepID=A0A9P4H919_9PLEO|nr:hypothetical protein EK21DRAFT_112318 [Setomelanomma holmii]